jgi:signal transduction histidine kinase
LNQRLALLSIEVEASRPGPAVIPQVSRAINFDSWGTRVHEISSDVHRLSHQLHPSKLDHLGLVAAVKSLCREISVLRGMRIEFHTSNVPAETHKELALCLFRIAQEALSNVITHSGALMARVELTGKPDALLLRITDSGKGFDLARAKLKGRLGLISMEERLRCGGTSWSIKGGSRHLD